MIVYAKEINGKLIPAQNGYDGITGLADSPELCIANGFLPFDAGDFAKLQVGMAAYSSGVITDISETATYINSQKAIRKSAIVSEYKDLFKELDITYSGKVSRGAATASAYTSARTALQLELVTKLSEV